MDYNSRLLPIQDKGLCGDPEKCEKARTLNLKVNNLADLLCTSKRIVAFTGAGISTSCGIPDFRGPNGVWTKELRGEKSSCTENWFDKAVPSYTHYALACLQYLGIVTHIVSQNVDSLHLRSGIPEASLTELHGNICKEKCGECGHEYVRDFDVGGMGLKPTGRLCNTGSCKGSLYDMAYDWDTDLPEDEFERAEEELHRADLVLTLGTSLRVDPAGDLPKLVLKATKERDSTVGKIVIVNLQCTKLDNLAQIRIFHYCDTVMELVCQQLGLIIAGVEQREGQHVNSTWYRIVPGSKLETLLQKRKLGNRREAAMTEETSSSSAHVPDPYQKNSFEAEKNGLSVGRKRDAVDCVDVKKKVASSKLVPTVKQKQKKSSPSKPEKMSMPTNVIPKPHSSTSIWEVVDRFETDCQQRRKI